MPIDCEVDREHGLLLTRASGHITLEDLRVYFSEVWADRANASLSEIFDWTGAERVDLSSSELHSLAGAANAFYDSNANSKLAIVAPGRRGARMSSLYQTFRELRSSNGPEIRTFQDIGSARSWVGLPTD